MIAVWILVLLCGLFGGAQFLMGLTLANSAPQQAAAAAIAIGWVVIPYVIGRAIEGFVTSSWRGKMLDAVGRITSDANYKSGVESLWKQLEAIRAQTASPPATTIESVAPMSPAATPPLTSSDAALSLKPMGWGHCPDCYEMRHSGEKACKRCKSRKPVSYEVTNPKA